MIRQPPRDDARAPTLLDARATGGIHGGDGFAAQDRYLALSIPQWLAEEGFERFQPERNEDIDVWFDVGRDHHQVKMESLARGAVRSLVADFRGRNAKLINEGRLRRYLIACPHLASDVRGFAGKLQIHRQHHFGPGDEDERQASVATLRATADGLGLAEHFEFILDHVGFEQDLAVLAEGGEQFRDVLAVRLGRWRGIPAFDDAAALADALVRNIAQDRTRAWSRGDLRTLLDRELEAYRAGPARPRGDLVLVRHDTLKRVDLHPLAEDHAELFLGRRIIRLALDSVERMSRLDESTIMEVAAELAATEGPYRSILNSGDARILYYGFPHVPFAVLAGYLAQGHRQIALVEHDLETDRFAWKPDAFTTPAAVGVEPRDGRGAAQIRVSVSAHVRKEACAAVLPANGVGLDIHIATPDIGRGSVGSDGQARELASRLRRAMDQHVNGNPAFASVHLFAAVPVSVAFRLGQVLAHSGLPNCYAYNFDGAATPHYCWRLGLREAADGRRSVEVLGRK